MKTRYFLLMLIAGLAVGCADERWADSVSVDGIIGHVVRDDGKATRATMIDSPVDGIKFSWTAGDAIGVFDDTRSNTCFTASDGAVYDDGATAVFSAETSLPAGSFLAYYPYSEDAHGTVAELNLTMPATQQFVRHQLLEAPDASVNTMVGRGDGGSVNFRNVHAVVKVGYVPRDSGIVERVVFKDISGQPVSGPFTVKMTTEGIPLASFPTTGDDASSQLTLECGVDGVSVAPNKLSTFFIVVPARNYPRGFQIDFHFANGNVDTRTVGRTAGKTLKRAMVYTIGDLSTVTADDYSYSFYEEGGVILDDDLKAMVMSVEPQGFFKFEDEWGDYYDFVIKKDMPLTVGESFVVNTISEALPHGLMGRVAAINEMGDYQTVRVRECSRIEEVFKSVHIGRGNLFNPDSTINHDAFVALDIAKYVESIEPLEGFDGTATMVGDSIIFKGYIEQEPPATRSTNWTSFGIPKMDLNWIVADESYGGVVVRLAGSYDQFTALQSDEHGICYYGFKTIPYIDVDMTMNLKLEKPIVDVSPTIPGCKVCIAPMPCGPIVMAPALELKGFLKIAAVAQIQLKWSHVFHFAAWGTASRLTVVDEEGDNYDYDQYTRSVFNLTVDGEYLSTMPEPSFLEFAKPEELTGQLGLTTEAGLQLNLGFSFFNYNVLSAYVRGGGSLFTGMTIKEGGTNVGMSLSPIVEAGIATLKQNEKWVEMNFNEYWSMNLWPWTRLECTNGVWVQPVDRMVTSTNVKVNLPLKLDIASDCLYDYDVYIEVYKRNVNEPYNIKNETLVKRHHICSYDKSSISDAWVGSNPTETRSEVHEWNDLSLDVSLDDIYDIVVVGYNPFIRRILPGSLVSHVQVQMGTQPATWTDDEGRRHSFTQRVILISDESGHWEKEGQYYQAYYRR